MNAKDEEDFMIETRKLFANQGWTFNAFKNEVHRLNPDCYDNEDDLVEMYSQCAVAFRLTTNVKTIADFLEFGVA